MLRSVLGVVAGMIVAVVLVFVLEVAGHGLYPPPPGIHHASPEEMKAIVGLLPLGALIAVLVAWGCGTLVGACAAALIAGRYYVRHAMIVGLVITFLGCLPMLMIPHPLWFMVAAVVTLPVSAWLGAQLANVIRRPASPGGPQPYDMREKNMAC